MYYLRILITGHVQHGTRPETVQEEQPIKRNLTHDFTQTERDGSQAAQQQYPTGNILGGHLPPQQMGYDFRQGPHSQGQQRKQPSQHYPLPPHPPPPQEFGHDQVKQSNFPPAHTPFIGAQLGAQENVHSTQQPPVCQPPTLPQVQQQQQPPSVTTTSSSQCPLLSEVQIDQQIHKHQQRLHELQQQQQQLFLTQKYQQLLQIQQEAQQEANNLNLLLTFKRQLQFPQQAEQQQSGSLPHHQQKQSEQPPTPQQHHQKQYDNRQTVSEQPGQQFLHQSAVHVVHYTPQVAPDQPMNTNTQQTSMHGAHQGTKRGSHQDVMHEATQGAPPQAIQWGTAQKAAATTQLTQEQTSSLGQHRVQSETQIQGVQVQMEHRLTIQDHQTTTDTNGNSNVSPSHQPTDQTRQKSSMVSPHDQHAQTDALKDELKVLEGRKQVKEQLYKLQEKSATASLQGKALQVPLTEEDFSQEESQGFSQKGDFTQSPVSCQDDKYWYSEQHDITTYGLENNSVLSKLLINNPLCMY